MLSSGVYVFRRDETTKLDTGAIVGIACAAGALFLGGIGLFLIYWRRQKRYDRQSTARERPIEENHLAAYSPPVYTHDYKMGHDSTIAGSGSSARTFSPEFPKEGVFYSPGEPASVSAMPAHPAYIPRALVRPTPPSSQTIPTEVEPPRPQIALQPPPKPRSKSTKTRPDDLVMQAYLHAADGESVPSEIFRNGDNDSDRENQLQPPSPLQQQRRNSPRGLASPPHMNLSSSLPLRDPPRSSPRNAPTPTRSQVVTAPGTNVMPGLRTGTLARPQPSPPRLFIETGHERPALYVRDTDAGISAPMNISPPLAHQQFASPTEEPVQHGGYTSHSHSHGHHRDDETSWRIDNWMAGHPAPPPAPLQLQLRPRPRYQRDEVSRDSDVWG